MTATCGRFQSGVLAAFGLVLCGLAAGCGSDGEVEIATVEGTVKLDGKPLKGAQVVFQPKLKTDEQGGPSQAETDEDGHYVLRYTLHKEGALVGPHLVTIRTAVTTYDENDNEITKDEKVPAKYNANAEDNPEMNVEVEPGGSTFDFDLSSKGEIITPKEAENDEESGPVGGGCIY